MAHKLPPDALAKLMRNPHHIRNVSIIAHVDHGKTTITDGLIASNGIISHKIAGQVRYMDSTEEEQARGITMKSSAIALLHTDERVRKFKAAPASEGVAQVPYLITLVDSPGHVDFSVDVATATRVCDGACVIVDAVEGVCIQTHAVMRVAWREGVKPVLVINKIDRLIVELQLSPLEAYSHLLRIIEAANVIMSELLRADLMAHATASTASATPTSASAPPAGDVDAVYTFDAWGVDISEEEEAKIFFDPTRGNVVFASAIDGWAFSVDDFAALHASKLEVDRAVLRRALWGEYYYNPKTKRITTGAAAATANKGKPLAVSLMLERLWAMYDAALINPDEARVLKILGHLNITLPARDMQVKDHKVRLQAIMRAWLPLHAALLGMIVRRLPSPLEAQAKRAERLWPDASETDPETARSWSSIPLEPDMPLPQRIRRSRRCFCACDINPDADCIVYISKMFAVPRASLPDEGDVALSCTAIPASSMWGVPAVVEGQSWNLDAVSSPSKRSWRDDADASEIVDDTRSRARVDALLGGIAGSNGAEVLVAFARVFSGTLRKDAPLYVLGPKYDPVDPTADSCLHVSQITQPLSLYLMMGRDLTPLREAYAGSVVGIIGLSSHIMKTATLCSTPACVSLTPMTFQTIPLVKVAVEPADARDLPALEKGLALLNQADPCVDINVTDRGELQLSALGELHLDRCIKDLQTRFARVPINVSPPIMNFMETIIARTQVPAAGSAVSQTALPVALIPPDIGASLVQGMQGVVATTPDRAVYIRVTAAPLPAAAADILQTSQTVFRKLPSLIAQLPARGGGRTFDAAVADTLTRFRTAITDADAALLADVTGLWALGPRGVGPNAVFCRTSKIHVRGGTVDAGALEHIDMWALTREDMCASSPAAGSSEDVGLVTSVVGAVIQGFQLSTAAGPLCAEPLYGIAYFIEDIRILAGPTVPDEAESPTRSGSVNGGQVIAISRDAFRIAFEAASPRLMEAMYRCQLACSGGRGGGTSGEQLGKLYAVLNRRRGRVISEDMWDGTQTFVITAYLPVVESFGFADDLRSMTSGAATSPQLLFSHWEVLEQDPFFVPTTEDEREEFGDVVHEGQMKNLAKKYKDAVRERKGMPVDKKIVVHAEKQRTLSKKK